MKYTCPEEILKLFATEELAGDVGRQAVLHWMKQLKLEIGDEVLIPVEADGVLHSLTKANYGLH